jgi:hypothetical protein
MAPSSTSSSLAGAVEEIHRRSVAAVVPVVFETGLRQ